MRKIDKKLNLMKANVLSENRYLASKGLLKEYNNWDYPEGADADPSAPWNQEDDGEDDYSEDSIVNVDEIAAGADKNYSNPLTLENSFGLWLQAATKMGGKISTTLGDYIQASRLNDAQKLEFISYLNSVGEEENGVYSDGSDDFMIDLSNPDIQKVVLSINANPSSLNPEYSERSNGPERDYDGPEQDYDRPDSSGREWGGMDF